MALGLGVSGCGSTPAASVAPSAPASRHSTARSAWVHVKDPSGASFAFPSATPAARAGSGANVTRTYAAQLDDLTAVTVLIIPTPVRLNVQNFVARYPRTLAAQGATRLKVGPTTPIMVQGSNGFQGKVQYAQPPGPAYLYEVRVAVQFPKYFAVISTTMSDKKALTASQLKAADKVNAALITGFRTGS